MLKELLKIPCNAIRSDSLGVQKVADGSYSITLKEQGHKTHIILSKETTLKLIEVLLDLDWSK